MADRLRLPQRHGLSVYKNLDKQAVGGVDRLPPAAAIPVIDTGQIDRRAGVAARLLHGAPDAHISVGNQKAVAVGDNAPGIIAAPF